MSSVKELIGRLNRLEDAGRYELALLVLSRVPPELESRPDVLRRRGRLLQRLARYDEAVDAFRRAGDDPKSLTLLKKCVEEQTSFLEAIGCYDRAASARQVVLKSSPEDVRELVNQGISYGMADRYDDALACFDRALKIAPENEGAWYNKGIALLDLGRLEEAMACFDKTVAINRSSALGWYQRAVCLVRKAEAASMPWTRSSAVNEARQSVGKALRIDPNLRDARQLLEMLEGE